MKTNELKQYHKNPRKITEKQFKELGNFLEEFGDLSGVVVNMPDKEIIGGNQRTRVFSLEDSQIEITERFDPPTKTGTIAVGFVTYKGERYQYREVSWPKEKAERANLIANKAGGTWDWDILVNEFDTDVLMNSGFDESDFIGHDFEPEPPKSEGPLPALKEEPKAKLGDIYQLGDHMLMCGDSTNTSHVEKLMGSNHATVAFCDPPYGVGYKYNLYDDAKDAEKYKEFTEKWFRNMRAYSNFQIITTGHFNKRMWYKIDDSCEEMVWLKKNAQSPGFVSYLLKTEPILCYGKPPISKYGMDLFEVLLDFSEDIEHTCPKPIALVEALIEPQTVKGDIVLDLFMGSGTTIMACERLGRKAYGIELDPRYVDLIIERWERYTGLKASPLSPVEGTP